MPKERFIKGRRVMTVREALRDAVFSGICAKDTGNWDRVNECRRFIRANFKHRHLNYLTFVK